MTEENKPEETASTPENVTTESVREALRAVMDPELHLDVIALGLVETVDIEKTPAEVKMLLTTPFCPYPYCTLAIF